MRKRKTEISASHEKIMKEKFPFSFHMQDKMYISGLSNLDRKYPPGDSDILLQLQVQHLSCPCKNRDQKCYDRK